MSEQESKARDSAQLKAGFGTVHTHKMDWTREIRSKMKSKSDKKEEKI